MYQVRHRGYKNKLALDVAPKWHKDTIATRTLVGSTILHDDDLEKLAERVIRRLFGGTWNMNATSDEFAAKFALYACDPEQEYACDFMCVVMLLGLCIVIGIIGLLASRPATFKLK